jgi:hypothetical protein
LGAEQEDGVAKLEAHPDDDSKQTNEGDVAVHVAVSDAAVDDLQSGESIETGPDAGKPDTSVSTSATLVEDLVPRIDEDTLPVATDHHLQLVQPTEESQHAPESSDVATTTDAAGETISPDSAGVDNSAATEHPLDANERKENSAIDEKELHAVVGAVLPVEEEHARLEASLLQATNASERHPVVNVRWILNFSCYPKLSLTRYYVSVRTWNHLPPVLKMKLTQLPPLLNTSRSHLLSKKYCQKALMIRSCLFPQTTPWFSQTLQTRMIVLYQT